MHKNIIASIIGTCFLILSPAPAKADDDLSVDSAKYYLHLGSEKLAPIANDRNIDFSFGRWNCIAFQAQTIDGYVSRELTCAGPLHIYTVISICNPNVPHGITDTLKLGGYHVSLECDYEEEPTTEDVKVAED